MAITCVPIPVANGRVHTTNQPTVATVSDTNLAKYTALFNASAEQRLHFTWWLPANYFSGDLTVRLRWRANATSGACVWKIYYRFVAAAGGITASGSNASTTTTTAGTANLINETVVTLTTGIAASRFVPFCIARDAAAGGDTLAVDAELLEILLEYTSDGTTAKQYVWFPANSFAVTSGSGCTLAGRAVATTAAENSPYVMTFPDASTSTADARMNLPSNYLGNGKVTLVIFANSASTTALFEDAATAAVGASADPSLTTGSTFNVTSPSTSAFSLDSTRALPVTPTASDELILRLRRDNADTSTATCEIFGAMLEYDVSSASPAPIRLDPASGALPSGSAASFARVDGSNSSTWVAQYADGSDLIADYIGFLPSIYASGGTLRIRWRSSAASGNGRFRVDFASPATSAASDPALTSGTAADFSTAGTGLINEATFSISSGLAASDLLYVRVVREGSHGNDTLSASVDVLDVVAETTPST